MAGGRAPLIGMALVGVALTAAVALPRLDLPWTAPRDDGELPSCGSVDLRIDSGVVDVPAEQAACLFGPAARRSGAELVVITSTDEGASIYRYFRHHPGQAGLEVMEDQTEDSFYGSGGWTVSRCPDAVSLDRLGPCTVDD